MAARNLAREWMHRTYTLPYHHEEWRTWRNLAWALDNAIVYPKP